MQDKTSINWLAYAQFLADHLLPTTLNWEVVDGILKPKLSCVQLAPESVVELLKCSCNKSRCGSARCQHNLPCTELCKCEAGVDCENIPTAIIENDAEEN